MPLILCHGKGKMIDAINNKRIYFPGKKKKRINNE